MTVLTQSATGRIMDWLQLTATACETTCNQSRVVSVQLRSKWNSKKCGLIRLPFVTGYKTGLDFETLMAAQHLICAVGNRKSK